MMKDPAPTLEAIAKLGYRYVEGALVPSLAPAVKAAGLKQVSAYLPTYLVTGNRQAWASGGDRDLLPESYTLDAAILEAKERGLQYLVVTYLQKAERGGLDVYRRVAVPARQGGRGLPQGRHHARLSRALVRVRADRPACGRSTCC